MPCAVTSMVDPVGLHCPAGALGVAAPVVGVGTARATVGDLVTPYVPITRSRFTWSYHATYTTDPSAATATCGSSPWSLSLSGIWRSDPAETEVRRTWSVLPSYHAT